MNCLKTEKKDTTVHPVVIDVANIMERIEQVSPNFGTQYLMNVFQKDKKTIVIYRSDHDQGKTSLWKTVIEPFEQNKTEKINGAEAGGFDVEGTADKCFALFNGNIYRS